MIIGLCGTLSSGKDTVANYLVSRGFNHVSTGDIIREEVIKRGQTITRTLLQDVGNELREKYGPGYLAKMALAKYKDNVVVSGLRNMGEVGELRDIGGNKFILIAIDAPIEKRWEWSKGRGRIGDKWSLEEFKKSEERERSEEKNSQQLFKVIAAADFLVQNSGTKEELLEKVDKILEKFH